MDSRILPLFSGLVVELVLGEVLVLVVTPPLTGTSVPSHGSTTGTGCAETDEPRAWIGQVPSTDYRAAYLTNYSFVHDGPDLKVRTELIESEPDAWIFAVTTTPRDSHKEVPDDCQPRTRLDASVALPTSAESLRITLDGEPGVTVETTANAPRFRYLDE